MTKWQQDLMTRLATEVGPGVIVQWRGNAIHSLRVAQRAGLINYTVGGHLSGRAVVRRPTARPEAMDDEAPIAGNEARMDGPMNG